MKKTLSSSELRPLASSKGGTRFSDCLCLRLRKSARQITNVYDDFLSPAGIRITQFGLLAHLEEHRAPLALAELAADLLMDPTTLNRNLKPLERQGFLQIKGSDRDRRAKEISLTSAGRDLLALAAPLWKAANDSVTKALGETAAGRLASLIDHSLLRLGRIEKRDSNRR